MNEISGRAYIEVGGDEYKALSDCDQEEIQAWLNQQGLVIEEAIRSQWGTFQVAVQEYKMIGLILPDIELPEGMTVKGGEL